MSVKFKKKEVTLLRMQISCMFISATMFLSSAIALESLYPNESVFDFDLLFGLRFIFYVGLASVFLYGVAITSQLALKLKKRK